MMESLQFQFPAYMIAPLNDVQLRLGRVLDKYSIDVQKQSISKEDSLVANKGSEASLQNSSTQKEKELTPTTPIVEQPASSSTPPFPQR